MPRDSDREKARNESLLNNTDNDIGFLYKTMLERDPKKRKVKPVESLLTLAADLDDSDDDSDYMPTELPDDDDDDCDDDDVESDSDADDDHNDNQHHIDPQTKSNKAINKKWANADKKSLNIVKSNEISSVSHKTIVRSTHCSTTILVCSVCLGDISRSEDEIVECDSCGISVHEGCYGIVSDDNESVHSNTSSASTEPWFCDPCKANVTNCYCELCPNSGGIFKVTDVGRWVHMVCALYIPGVAFSDVTKLTGLTLFEMPYSRWGVKSCILCEDERLSRTGVCIGCDAGMCKSYFHVTCAQREGLLSESHSVDEVDPFFAYCKLHADRATVKTKRRNWLALQSKSKLEVVNSNNQRIQLKLAKQRNKWKLARNELEGNTWVPTQKMPRLLTTSPSAVKRLIRKAELLGLSPQTHIPSQDVVDVRRKWHVPPAFSIEYISYYIDRNNRMTSMQKRSEELINQNSQLKETEKIIRSSYDQHLQNIDKLKSENDVMRNIIQEYWTILNYFSGKNIPLPKLIETPESPKKANVTGSTSKPKSSHSSVINISECGICHQTKDQHQLALCDSCQLFYHLYCLDPPLTRMPKKTRFGGWQCSDCTEQQETQESDNETSNQSVVDAPRKLREHVKGPNKFEPDAGYSPPSSVSSASKMKKRKIGSGLYKRKKRKLAEESISGNSETSEKLTRSKSISTVPKKLEHNEEECFQCNQMANYKQRVQCDNCEHFYHLSCLNPPVKKSPKQRGYTWYCEHCDISDDEDEDEEEEEEDDEAGDDEVEDEDEDADDFD